MSPRVCGKGLGSCQDDPGGLKAGSGALPPRPQLPKQRGSWYSSEWGPVLTAWGGHQSPPAPPRALPPGWDLPCPASGFLRPWAAPPSCALILLDVCVCVCVCVCVYLRARVLMLHLLVTHPSLWSPGQQGHAPGSQASVTILGTDLGLRPWGGASVRVTVSVDWCPLTPPMREPPLGVGL